MCPNVGEKKHIEGNQKGNCYLKPRARVIQRQKGVNIDDANKNGGNQPAKGSSSIQARDAYYRLEGEKIQRIKATELVMLGRSLGRNHGRD